MPPSFAKRTNDALAAWGPWPYIALTLSMLFFASNHILGRLIPGEVPPIGISFWRWIVATLVILPFTWKDIRRSSRLILQNWKIFSLLTFCLVILGNTTVYIALVYTTAINAAIVSMVQPAITILLSWIFFKETVNRGQSLGVVVAACGVLIVVLRGDLAALALVEFNVGDLWMVVSVVGFASYATLLRLAPKDVPPLVLLNILQFLGIIVLLPFYIWESIVVMPMHLNTTTVISVLWAGLIVAVAAMGLWNMGDRMIGANKASAFVYVRSLLVTVLAILILDEYLEQYHFAAFALIIVGVYLVSRSKRREQGKQKT